MIETPLPAAQKPHRPPLHYYGGKWRIADWIISHFPAHDCYVEPFGGGASVLLSKAPTRLEVLNDIDQDVVTFFRVLRERSAEILRAIELTPYSRAEFANAHGQTDDELERARRLYVRAWQGRGGTRQNAQTSWRYQAIDTRGTTITADWVNLTGLPAIVKRLRGVQIECLPWQRILQAYDQPGTLFYCDPPYVFTTRTSRWSNNGYAHEMTDTDHAELADALHEVKGFAIISGYPSELYDRLYDGWPTSQVTARVTTGKKRTEKLWISPRTAAQIVQRPLSFGALDTDKQTC